MELLLICGVTMLVTVFIGTAVYFIMTLGTKEKTYEEAILEQRQRSEDALLLGKSAKEKQKEKKLKKAGKKVKEKLEKVPSLKETTDNLLIEETDQSASHHKNQHVAFVAEPAVIDEPVPSSDLGKKKKKVTKAKPILINKDDTQVVVEPNPPVDVNHFETIHPKDDLEMRRLSRDETSDLTSKKAAQKLIEAEKATTKKKEVASKAERPQIPRVDKQSTMKLEKPAAKVEKQVEVVPAVKDNDSKAITKVVAQKLDAEKEKKTIVQEAVVTVTNSAAPVSAPSKNNKKKKIEQLLEQMTAGRDGINSNFLEPLILKAELSRSEIQNLIDILLNKQQGSETDVAEWNEGRQDPMMKLKKAYAEKEKALHEEQEACLALQNKLREVRAEANMERSRLSAANKQLEEKILSRTNEIAAATAKFHHEKQTYAQQLQQLKHQLDQDHQVLRKYQEELGQAQNAIQNQQTLEHHVTNLTQQIVLLQQQLAESQGAVQQCELLSAQVGQLQEQLKNAQNSSQGEVHSKQKQLNEVKASKEEIERQLSAAHLRESQLTSELAKLKEIAAQRQTDIDKLAIEAGEAAKLRDENKFLSSQVSHMSQLQSEARQLREENESLAAQVTAVTERPAAEGRENGDVGEEKQADGKIASSHLINQLQERDLKVEELLEQVKQVEKSAASTIDTLKSEITAHKNEVAHLTKELEHQRKKNDELRNKNYKVMDALAESEKMFRSKVQEADKLVHEAEKTVRGEEQMKVRETLQRLFPSISVEEKVHDEWLKKFSAAVKKYVADLSNRVPQKTFVDEEQSCAIAELEKRNAQLTGMVANYKRIIEDSEGILIKLQQHVEAEEAKWQKQLADKETELSAVMRERDELRNCSSNIKNTEVESQLQELQKKLGLLEAERISLNSKLASSEEALDTVDQLKHERNRLSADLATEQAKALEQSNQLAKLKTILEQYESEISQEKASSQQLRQEIEKLKESYSSFSISTDQTVQNHNGETNGPATTTEAPSAEKPASKKKNLSGWLKKIGGSKSPQHSPNLSARSDDFLTNERMESS